LGWLLLRTSDAKLRHWPRAYELLSKSNHVAARLLHSLCLERGFATKSDPKAADDRVRPFLTWSRPHAFNPADALAAWEMGRMIAKEKGLTHEDESAETKALTAADAVRFYEQSTDPLATYRLAGCYADGRGVGRDLPRALTLYRKSVDWACFAQADVKHIGTTTVSPTPTARSIRCFACAS
jgi:TPR repeat protein